MTASLLACIADDYTGATDLASMLARAGLRVIQCFGVPTERKDFQLADAIVVALKSRSIPAQDAVNMSLASLAFLQSLGAERFFFKYCSTFDSTSEGNIGPVADALAAALDANQVLFCPAFPENGRTVYCGHLFVNGVPLHESGMKDHPLNPMNDSNLVRVLQSQSQRTVAWAPLRAQLRSLSDQHYVVDAITDDDLRHVAQLAKDHRMLTGGSAIARYWAEAIPVRTSIQVGVNPTTKFVSSPCVILAGSCSNATRQQVAEFEKKYPVLHVDVASATNPDAVVASALEWCDSQWRIRQDEQVPLLISTSAKQELVMTARTKYGERDAAEFAERVFANLAKLLQQRGVKRIIVAGGETSGAVINALDIKTVRIGTEIAPGVPWITTLQDPKLSLALKSGNFGGPRFFLDALEQTT